VYSGDGIMKKNSSLKELLACSKMGTKQVVDKRDAGSVEMETSKLIKN